MPGSPVITSLPASSSWRTSAGRRVGRRRGLVPYLFIAPNITLFTAFSFLPLIYAVYLSFRDWALIGEPNFIGIGNYLRLVHDPLFWRALTNTLLYAADTVPTSMAIGLLLALALNRRLPARSFLRSLYFLPLIVSPVATGTIAAWMFNDNYGVLNALLVRLGRTGPCRRSS